MPEITSTVLLRSVNVRWVHRKRGVDSEKHKMQQAAHSRSNTLREAVCSRRGQITYRRFIRGICSQSATTTEVTGQTAL